MKVSSKVHIAKRLKNLLIKSMHPKKLVEGRLRENLQEEKEKKKKKKGFMKGQIRDETAALEILI